MPNTNDTPAMAENLLVIDDPYWFSGMFAFLFSAGNIDDVAALYTMDALLIGLDGRHHRGRDAIVAYLGRLLSQGKGLRHESRNLVVQSESALLSYNFQLMFQKSVVCSGLGVTVLRRDSDNGWRAMIENPFVADWHQGQGL